MPPLPPFVTGLAEGLRHSLHGFGSGGARANAQRSIEERRAHLDAVDRHLAAIDRQLAGGPAADRAA